MTVQMIVDELCMALQGRANAEKASAMTDDEYEELKALRKETKVLRMERDLLKKSVAFFVRENETW